MSVFLDIVAWAVVSAFGIFVICGIGHLIREEFRGYTLDDVVEWFAVVFVIAAILGGLALVGWSACHVWDNLVKS